MKNYLPVIFLVLVLVIPVLGKYYTLEGPDFYVHFPKGYEDLAAKLMVQAEDIMPRLSEELKSQIHGKTHLVIEDCIDLSNGYTANYAYPLISFFTVFPDDMLMGGLGPNVGDWFEMLLWHEGTHLYHLEMQDPFSYAMSYLFGRDLFYYPFWQSPASNIEGLAVYNETKYQNYGRGSDAIYRMVLDAAIDAEDIPDPKLILGRYELDRFDFAGFYYLYGWNFMEFLTKNYDPNAPLTLQTLYLDNKGGLFLSKFDSALIALTGKKYTTLAKEWQIWLKENYDLPELTPEGKIYANSGYIIFPGFFKDNYFYYAQTGKVSPGLYRINLENEQEELLAYIPNIYGSISQDRLGKIYFSKLDQDQKGNYFFNIYCYDKGRIEPAIINKRAYQPFPLGLDTIYYLRHIAGKGNALYKKTGAREEELVYQSQPGEEILQYVVGSTGVVFASIWREGGFTDLARIREGEIYYFTNDIYSDTYPILSNDETALYFQSNRDGHYGIWVYDLISRSVAPVVNNHYGAFKPVLNKNAAHNELAFVSYTHQGLRLGVYNWPGDANWEYIEDEDIPEPKVYPKIVDLLEDGYTLKQYTGVNWLKPVSWSPSFIGAILNGSDPLQTYYYSLGYNYNPIENTSPPKHDLSFSCNYNLNPLHSLSLSYNTTFSDSSLLCGYRGTIPSGKNSYALETSFDSRGNVSGGLAYLMPWGKKDLNGYNYVFGDISYNLANTILSFDGGSGMYIKISPNLNWSTQLFGDHYSFGFTSPGSNYMGENILIFNTKLNYVFARPMWVLESSPTMWSEKMQLSPLATLVLGEKDWDLGIGTELKNTTTLMYGTFPITYGLRLVYWPKANKVLFSPVIDFPN